MDDQTLSSFEALLTEKSLVDLRSMLAVGEFQLVELSTMITAMTGEIARRPSEPILHERLIQ